MTAAIHCGDCRTILATLPAQSARTCVTSPPYFGLRDYGVAGQIGLEATVEEYVSELVAVFREVRRVLTDDGTAWVNLGDSYAGGGGFSANAPSTESSKSGKYGALGALKSGGIKPEGVIKPKDLIGIPWRVAFALQADGWYLRQDLIWAKPNPMPESVTDRCTKAHEYLFLLSKRPRYHYDAAAIAEPAAESTQERAYLGKRPHSDKQDALVNGGMHGATDSLRVYDRTERNKRSVWTVATQPFKDAHFATFPPKLIEPCILAGSAPGDTVLDPFGGSGTTGLVADRLGRDAILVELNPEYARMAERRITNDAPLFATVEVLSV